MRKRRVPAGTRRFSFLPFVLTGFSTLEYGELTIGHGRLIARVSLVHGRCSNGKTGTEARAPTRTAGQRGG